jgi:translation initiation factor eIF-2B subunit alpha
MAEQDVRAMLRKAYEMEPDMTSAVAAIQVLISFISASRATTMMELQSSLKTAAAVLTDSTPDLSVRAGCDLFLRFVTRTSVEISDFSACRENLIARGRSFITVARTSRESIADVALDFITNGSTLLTSGYSRVVMHCIRKASEANRRFSVIVALGGDDLATSQDSNGHPVSSLRTCSELASWGVPTELVPDAAVVHAMARSDFCLFGAEAVVENGGTVNRVGTFQAAVLAKTLHKPFYIAAEAYKFLRAFPFDQHDLADMGVCCSLPRSAAIAKVLPPSVPFVSPDRDLTPPRYISLLITNMGVMSPHAVSDELIKLYS